MLDKNAENVLDTQLPYSSRLSCGGCHDMEKIGHAYHYEMGRDENDEQFGRARGMGALVSPGYFGGYNCMQGNNPQWLSKKSNTSQQNFLDYGAAGFIKACERCHTGGGFAEKDRTGRRYDSVDTAEIALFDGDYYEWDTQNTLQPWNWKRSGVIEPDCLACHVDFSGFTTTASQWSDLRNDQFIANGWFEYANSAIFAFLNVNTRQAEGAGKFLLSVENAGTQATPPTLQWHASAFDENGEIALPLRRFPASENCMQCHITSHERRGFYGFGDDVKVDSNPDKLAPVNPKSDVHKGKSWTEKGKVRTIENCNACHSKNYYKSGIDLSVDHQFLTGFSDQDVRRDLNYQPKPLSCEHCHGGKEWGSAEKPALPYSGQSTLLAAHRERWLSRGDMEGYATSTYNKTVQTHFNVVACQTCHITGLVDEKNQPLRLRYRYRLSEDGKPRIMPYLPASRYYWIDSTNQRVLSRAERLAATNGVESEPKTYQEIKTLKTRFDELLKAKGYANANTQMVWTESNDYLISHNTRPVAQTMPCVDCHDRKSNGAINPLVSETKILGASNERVVSELSDANAYPQLIKEGIVKLGLPYLSVSAQGKLVENVNDVLYDTKLNPFTSMLQSNQVNTLSGAMQVAPRGDVLNALSSTQSAALSTRLAKQVLWLRNPLIGDKMKNGWLLANDSTFNQRVLSNYRFALSAMAWSKTPSKKTPSFSMGTLGSEVFAFQSRCLQPEVDCLLDVFLMKDKLMLKLPYTGNVNNVTGVGLYAVTAAKEGEFNAPKTRIPADIIAVTARNEVILAVNTLPEYAVLVDLKNAKK
ncbi:MAG TPA: cytochrome C [Methylococcaceae bacterium]|nr:cytochrome C [Methylococcaceae bacterium]